MVAMLVATTFSTRSWLSERKARQGEQAAMIREQEAQRVAELAYHHLGNALSHCNSNEVIVEIEDARRNTLRIIDSLLVETPDHPKLLFQKSIALSNLSCPLRALKRTEESQA